MPIQVIDTANQFRGKIVEIVLGSVVSEVEVETPWGKVASVITMRAVRELGLETARLTSPRTIGRSESTGCPRRASIACAAVRTTGDGSGLSRSVLVASRSTRGG
jgi:molybdopterin-binding protein